MILGSRYPVVEIRRDRCELNPACPLAMGQDGESNMIGDKRCLPLLEVLGSFTVFTTDATITQGCETALSRHAGNHDGRETT